MINAYYCGGNKVAKVQLRGDGDINVTTGGNDFYTSQACIEYKIRGVKEGNLSVSVSIR